MILELSPWRTPDHLNKETNLYRLYTMIHTIYNVSINKLAQMAYYIHVYINWTIDSIKLKYVL